MEFCIVRTDQNIADIQTHLLHRTQPATKKTDEQQSMYCLDCQLKYATGTVLKLSNRRRANKWLSSIQQTLPTITE